NDHFFWVDVFACPASFPWNTSKTVSKYPFPKPSQYNAEHYATLVAYPTPFHMYPEPFLCLMGISRNYTLDEDTYPQFLREDDEAMDLLSFIWTADPTKVRIGERQRGEDEQKLLDTTEEKNDSAGSGQSAGIQIVSEAAEIVTEDVVPLQPKHKKKRKTIVDAGEPSYPAKKLRYDHGTPGGPTVGGKSRSAVQRLLVGAMLNAKVRGEVIPTLPFMTSSMSATPEREEGDHTDSLAEANLRTIGAPQRFVISSDYSHHSGANIAEAEVESFARTSVPLMTMMTTVTSTADPATTAKEKLVESSIFGDGSSSRVDHTVGGFSGLTGSDFIVGGIRTIVSPDTYLQKVYVPQWSVTNGSRLDDGVARQMSLSAEVRMRAEFNIREKRRLSSFVEEKNSLLKARDKEIKSLKAQLLVKEAEATEAIHLHAEASKFKVVEKSLQDEIKSLKERNIALEKEKSVLDVRVADLAATVKVREQEAADLDAMVTTVKLQNDMLADQLVKFQDKQMAIMHEKFNKLDADFIETCLHLEEILYPHMLTTIVGGRWLLTYGMKLAVFKCLNSPKYLSALRSAISKAIEKGMQDGLAAEITHGQEGRVLTNVVAFNPSAEDDFTSALQGVQNVNFSLLAELESNKDTSVKTVMDLLRLDEALVERLGLNESQPHVDQLMGHAHHSPDQTVIGARALSLSLDVSHPLSVAALEGAGGTSSVAPDTTTALSVTLVFASTILPIFMDDYEVMRTDGQEGAGVEVNPFPNVDDVELDISQ
ncbi:hypothetical protein Tco_0511221, partial [Tanacetum coccineum]